MVYIGCGNIARAFATTWADHVGVPKSVTAYDIKVGEAGQFLNDMTVNGSFREGETRMSVALSSEDALVGGSVICFATTAKDPHVRHLNATASDAVIHHLSLRDINPEDVVQNANITDVVDHACSHATSLALAEKMVGNRGFINGTVTDLLGNRSLCEELRNRKVIFSPFGLALLDVYFAMQVYKAYMDIPRIEANGFC